MDELEQKQAAQHLDLYCADGRCYDISEEDGVLTLQLRRSVRADRSIITALITVTWLGLYALMIWMSWNDPNFRDVIAFTTSLGIVLPLQLGWGCIALMKRGVIWKFAKGAAKVKCNDLENADISKIQGVRAWRRGRRFYIALRLPYGQTLKLGRLAFARSERAWRDDAAQIAAFLGVPLEIAD